MEYLGDFFTNRILWVSILACFVAQFLKMFTGERKIDIGRILISGGMPSSHSAFVTCMSVLIGRNNGFGSDLFALSAVISCIIMYDASGVRRAVGKQAKIVNQLVEDWQMKRPIEHEKLKELVGHTPKQVLFGALLGVVIGMIL
ncbi:divergent PAP2 family protein [Peptostreptococcus faecalis]|uniref:divergent PAP2 family protein n=1 Tax=Peptostreptococcus faecalis TaxID=2045015 RepID=UPI000C7D1C15|nr:divergent PAP2 family protein [Peptostreptococcus faecalis]